MTDPTPRLTAEEVEQEFNNLMAVINRDGGYKSGGVGLREAGEHCQAVVVSLRGASEEAHAKGLGRAAEMAKKLAHGDMEVSTRLAFDLFSQRLFALAKE